ncbi:MAG: GerAB/ArcD/ProY family transporter [Oscillospiraceae bacterium]|nr:GerAB/ArcD/ProY family transporter [Oscillospiraceae bacterium]
MNGMSASQRDAWLWAATLGPATAFLPVTAARAGAGGWVAPMLALPAVLAADRLMRRVSRGGLVHNLCDTLGVGAARILTAIYVMWAVLLGGVQMYTCAQRLAAVEPAGGSWPVTGAVVLLAVWFAKKSPAVMARWSVPVLGWLLAGLGVVAGLALLQARWDNLVPLWSNGEGLLGAVVLALGVLCVRVYGGFLWEGTEREAGGGLRWPAVVCGVLSVLLLAAQGSLGVELAARMENPLLALSRNIGVEGTFQRAESLVASVLLLADLALVTLLLCAVETGVRRVWRVPRGRSAVVSAVAMLSGAAAGGGVPMRLLRVLIPAGNLLLGVGVPLLVLAVRRIRDKKQGAYLVPEKEEKGTS